MAEIPADTVTPADLVEWDRLQTLLKKTKASEMLLRQKIFGGFFTAPVEGTNSAPLANGWMLKGKYTINREVDPGALAALKEQLIAANLSADKLVQYKPSLVLSEYRTLTEEQRQLFDRALIIKPGAPALEITLPAKAKKAGEQA